MVARIGGKCGNFLPRARRKWLEIDKFDGMGAALSRKWKLGRHTITSFKEIFNGGKTQNINGRRRPTAYIKTPATKNIGVRLLQSATTTNYLSSGSTV